MLSDEKKEDAKEADSDPEAASVSKDGCRIMGTSEKGCSSTTGSLEGPAPDHGSTVGADMPTAAVVSSASAAGCASLGNSQAKPSSGTNEDDRSTVGADVAPAAVASLTSAEAKPPPITTNKPTPAPASQDSEGKGQVIRSKVPGAVSVPADSGPSNAKGAKGLRGNDPPGQGNYKPGAVFIARKCSNGKEGKGLRGSGPPPIGSMQPNSCAHEDLKPGAVPISGKSSDAKKEGKGLRGSAPAPIESMQPCAQTDLKPGAVPISGKSSDAKKEGKGLRGSAPPPIGSMQRNSHSHTDLKPGAVPISGESFHGNKKEGKGLRGSAPPPIGSMQRNSHSHTDLKPGAVPISGESFHGNKKEGKGLRGSAPPPIGSMQRNARSYTEEVGSGSKEAVLKAESIPEDARSCETKEGQGLRGSKSRAANAGRTGANQDASVMPAAPTETREPPPESAEDRGITSRGTKAQCMEGICPVPVQNDEEAFFEKAQDPDALEELWPGRAAPSKKGLQRGLRRTPEERKNKRGPRNNQVENMTSTNIPYSVDGPEGINPSVLPYLDDAPGDESPSSSPPEVKSNQNGADVDGISSDEVELSEELEPERLPAANTSGPQAASPDQSRSNQPRVDDTELISAHLVDEDAIEETFQRRSDEIRVQLIEEAVVASDVIEVKPKTFCRKYKFTFCSIVVIVAVILAATLSTRDNGTKPLAGYDYLFQLSSSISRKDTLIDETTPQYKALNWLAFEDGAKIPQNSSSEDELTDRYVMALLYFAMGGPGWLDQMSFLGNTSVCEWPPVEEDETIYLNGIRCDTDGRVNHIRLDTNNLTGTIVDELSAVKSVDLLSLRGNFLTGIIPSSLGSLPKIELLALLENALTGTIPDALAELTTLKTLVLLHNALTGSIPDNLAKIDMDRLFLSGNKLTGTIPAFGATQSRFGLQVLSLFDNNLEGPIPESLFSLNALEILQLYYNKLTGTLSTRIGSLEELWKLDISSNRMNGTVPSEIGKAKNLEWLALEYNSFSGGIPKEIGSLARLERLSLKGNRLAGSIPANLGSCTNMDHLNLEENMLTGQIPSELMALTRLGHGFVGLQNNSFTGSLERLFCNESVLFPPPSILTADCDELECSCCTDCCQDSSGECIVNVDQICLGTLRLFEFDGQVVGTECQCLANGFELSCWDTNCQVCNQESSVCLENYDYGNDFTEDGSDHLYKCNMQFVSGRSEQILWKMDWMEEECSVSVNGTKCNDCDIQRCSDSVEGLLVDCSNVEEGAVYDDCDASLNGGGLLWFLAPNHFQSDCSPCVTLKGSF